MRMYERRDPKYCAGTHSKDVLAVDRRMCRRHLNRVLQDERIAAYIEESAPRCPDHPDQNPGVSRWFGSVTPMMFCSAPTGDLVRFPQIGQGRLRQPGGQTYTAYCKWKKMIPEEVINPGGRKP